MTVYARILLDDKCSDIMEIRGSRTKEHLYDRLPCEYLVRGLLNEDLINSSLEEIKPVEIYIDSFTLNKLSYGLYKKYRKVIVEELYEPSE